MVKALLNTEHYSGWGRSTLRKTHANRINTSKVRKHLHQFDDTCTGNTHNTSKDSYYHQVNTLQMLLTPENTDNTSKWSQ